MTDVGLGLESSWERERDNEGVLLDGVAWTDCLGALTSLVFQIGVTEALMVMWDEVENSLKILFLVFSWI